MVKKHKVLSSLPYVFFLFFSFISLVALPLLNKNEIYPFYQWNHFNKPGFSPPYYNVSIYHMDVEETDILNLSERQRRRHIESAIIKVTNNLKQLSHQDVRGLFKDVKGLKELGAMVEIRNVINFKKKQKLYKFFYTQQEFQITEIGI